MSKIPKDAIQKLTIFQQEVSKLFKNIFSESASEQKKVFPNINFPILADVFESDDEVCVEVELPGVNKNEINLSVSEDAIVITGIKKDVEKPPVQFNYYSMERDFGKFNRVIELPTPCDTRQIKAVLTGGLLSIKLPKIKERRGRARQIDIVGE